MFRIDHDMTERQEVDVYRALREVVDSVPREIMTQVVLTLGLPHEESHRRKLPADHPMILLLDEYHERVRLGLRDPIKT